MLRYTIQQSLLNGTVVGLISSTVCSVLITASGVTVPCSYSGFSLAIDDSVLISFTENTQMYTVIRKVTVKTPGSAGVFEVSGSTATPWE